MSNRALRRSVAAKRRNQETLKMTDRTGYIVENKGSGSPLIAKSTGDSLFSEGTEAT